MSEENIKDSLQRTADLQRKTILLLYGPYISYNFMSPGLNRHASIYPSELSAEQQERLKQAEAILFELADSVEEEVKTKTARKPPEGDRIG
jgi:hypothetical protein